MREEAHRTHIHIRCANVAVSPKRQAEQHTQHTQHTHTHEESREQRRQGIERSKEMVVEVSLIRT